MNDDQDQERDYDLTVFCMGVPTLGEEDQEDCELEDLRSFDRMMEEV